MISERQAHVETTRRRKSDKRGGIADADCRDFHFHTGQLRELIGTFTDLNVGNVLQFGENRRNGSLKLLVELVHFGVNPRELGIHLIADRIIDGSSDFIDGIVDSADDGSTDTIHHFGKHFVQDRIEGSGKHVLHRL